MISAPNIKCDNAKYDNVKCDLLKCWLGLKQLDLYVVTSFGLPGVLFIFVSKKDIGKIIRFTDITYRWADLSTQAATGVATPLDLATGL